MRRAEIQQHREDLVAIRRRNRRHAVVADGEAAEAECPADPVLAGLALGDGGIAPVPAAGPFIADAAAIGVVLLLLTLGLEFSISELSSSLRRHVPSALVDICLNATPESIAMVLSTLRTMRTTHRNEGLEPAIVTLFQREYLTAVDQALTVEAALER